MVNKVLINSFSCCLTYGEAKEAVVTFSPRNPVFSCGKVAENDKKETSIKNSAY